MFISIGESGIDVPGQELGDAVDEVVGDVGEDVSQVVLRVDSVELGGAEQGVDSGSSFSTSVRSSQKEISASEGDGAQRSFGGVVVDLDRAIIEVARESSPA